MICKPTFTDMRSVLSFKYKVGLVRFFSRALRTSSDGKLSNELEFLKELHVLVRNGYPSNVMNKLILPSSLMEVGILNTGQRVVFRSPYVGERHCDHTSFDLLFVVPLMM